MPQASLSANGDREVKQGVFLAFRACAAQDPRGICTFPESPARPPTKKVLAWIAKGLGFDRSDDLEKWVSSVKKLAADLQNIAPAEAENGPNPEYPWPHEKPVHYPAGHKFALWNELSNTGQGRKLMEFVRHAISRFDQYA